MRRLFGLCILAIWLISPGAQKSFAQDTPSYVNPFVPSKAPPGVAQKAREAAIRTLNAHCTLTEAHRLAVNGSNHDANKSVASARTGFAVAAQMFLDVAKSLNVGILLNPPERDDVRRAYASLERYGIRRPKSYAEAFAVMHDEIEKNGSLLSDIVIAGSPSDTETLAGMTGIQGRIAEVFLDITILTVYGSG